MSSGIGKADYKFERIEKKFWLSTTQYQALLPLFDERLNRDRFGTSTIRSLYQTATLPFHSPMKDLKVI